MTDLLPELRAKWAQALVSGKADREWRAVALSIAAPVNLLAGVRDQDGRISVLVETLLRHAPKHRVRFHAEGISLIDQRWMEDGLLRLAITLERLDLQDIFEVLVIDLVAVAAASSSAQPAIQQILRRLESWQVCLRARRGGLQREEQAGLLGEIAVLQKLATEVGLPQAITAWTGPLDGIHDFQLAGLGVEVKSTIGVSHHVRISRLDQLDPEGLDQLLLARTRFHEASEGMTLPEVIGGLRKTINEVHPASIDEFSDKIMRTGYLDTDAEFYASTRTILSDFHLFKVGEGFPSLTRASVPAAVVEAAYSLDERQLAAFRVTDEAWRASLRRIGEMPQMCGGR
jgi:Putative  PD-(D/E)XK family member, (DUF4420)